MLDIITILAISALVILIGIFIGEGINDKLESLYLKQMEQQKMISVDMFLSNTNMFLDKMLEMKILNNEDRDIVFQYILETFATDVVKNRIIEYKI